MSERIHLFSNGSQFYDWLANNCDRCGLAGDGNERGSSECDIFEAIHDAGADDGTVSADIARRCGYNEKALEYTWRCPAWQKDPSYARLQKNDLEALAAWNAGLPIKA